MSDTPVIRLLAHDDLDALLRLYAQLHPGDVPATAERIGDTWASILSSPALQTLGAFVDLGVDPGGDIDVGLELGVGERLVACCSLCILPNLTRGCRPYALVENVVTDAAYRRQGHGRRLLQAAAEWARDAGCYKLMLLTGRKDAATLAFYRAVGFDAEAKQGLYLDLRADAA